MKKMLLIFVLTSMPKLGFSQLGINTASPNAQLDINSSNQVTPANTDGILIPKIDAFPVTNPTLAQNSMMVYLTTTSAGKLPGFYYWDNATTSWKGFGAGAVALANGTAIGNTMYWDGTTWINNSSFLFNNGTSIGINTAIPSSILTVKKDGIGFAQEDGTGTSQIGFYTDATKAVLQTHTNSDLSFATNDGATQMTLQSTTGNLGIDALNPAEKLEVNGKTKTTNLQVTNGAGLGKLLSSDDLGNGVWKNTTDFSWLLTGNAGINPNYNFIGTTDDKDVVFKRYNLTSGLITLSNTAFGLEALESNTGIGNSAFGKWVLYRNLSGNNNAAFGWAVFYDNVQADQNAIFGADASKSDGLSNSTGAGFRVLQSSSGDENTSLGDYSHAYTYDSSKNVVIGKDAYVWGGFNNGGVPYDTNNVAVGNNAINSNANTATTNGINNTVIGNYALETNETGNNNTALGNSALNMITSESNNTAIGANATVPAVGNNNQLSIANVFYGANLNDINTAYFSNGALSNNKYKLYNYANQSTANGDGQYGLFSYRTRDSRNDGVSYSSSGTNGAIGGRNYWGDSYTFGVAGHSDNDYNRSGGILGSNSTGTYWSSLGYNNSAGATYGIYATAALASGAGRFTKPQSQTSIGGGFYGGLIGSWSKGALIGEINSGNTVSTYNSGDEYTHGKQIEIVDTPNKKIATYAVTASENIVYNKGKVNLVHGFARVNFDINYVRLLSDIPEITMTAMGQCNGIYIESIDTNGFTIKELNNGITNIAVSWIALGDSIDNPKASAIVLEQNFDANINEVMFNENHSNQSAKAIWAENNKMQFGTLPNHLETPIQKE